MKMQIVSYHYCSTDDKVIVVKIVKVFFLQYTYQFIKLIYSLEFVPLNILCLMPTNC